MINPVPELRCAHAQFTFRDTSESLFKVIKDGEFVLRTMISCGMMALVYVGYCWAADLMATGQTFPLILAIMISTLTTVAVAAVTRFRFRFRGAPRRCRFHFASVEHLVLVVVAGEPIVRACSVGG